MFFFYVMDMLILSGLCGSHFFYELSKRNEKRHRHRGKGLLCFMRMESCLSMIEVADKKATQVDPRN